MRAVRRLQEVSKQCDTWLGWWIADALSLVLLLQVNRGRQQAIAGNRRDAGNCRRHARAGTDGHKHGGNHCSTRCGDGHDEATTSNCAPVLGGRHISTVPAGTAQGTFKRCGVGQIWSNYADITDDLDTWSARFDGTA